MTHAAERADSTAAYALTRAAARAQAPSGRSPALRSRIAAEAVGTGLLVATVVGSGIAATRLMPGQPGLQLLANSTATAAVLVALVLALQPVSAAFNPVVTLVERLAGVLTTAEACALVGAQVVGGCVGAVLANLMFDLAPVTVSTHVRATSTGVLLAEVLATFGLVVLVFATVRAGRERSVAYVVAGWIAAAYWATSSTSFANPAVTVARTLTDSFAGIAPASAPAFVAAQVVGGLLAVAALRILHPRSAEDLPTTTEDEK